VRSEILRRHGARIVRRRRLLLGARLGSQRSSGRERDLYDRPAAIGFLPRLPLVCVAILMRCLEPSAGVPRLCFIHGATLPLRDRLWTKSATPLRRVRLLTGACAEHRLEDDAHHSPKNWGNNDASDEQAERRDLWIGRAAGHRANEGETAARHDAASH